MQSIVLTAMQGDAYEIPFSISQEDTPITPSNCQDLEIAIGKIIKRYSDKEIRFDGKEWFVQLTQEETFEMESVTLPVQVRVKFSEDNVIGEDVGLVCIKTSTSKEVL